jgi:hypothetical protein
MVLRHPGWGTWGVAEELRWEGVRGVPPQQMVEGWLMTAHWPP